MATKSWISTSSTSFNTAANWSTGSAPANSDTLIFDGLGTASCTTNLGSSLTGVTIIKKRSFVGSIGVLSATAQTYLTFVGGTLIYEQDDGGATAAGSSLCMIDFGSTAAIASVYNSATPSGAFPPLLLKGTSLTLYAYGGTTGVGLIAGEAPTLTALNATSGGGRTSPTVICGEGSTITALTVAAGTVTSRSSNTLPSVKVTGTGIYNNLGSGAHTSLTVDSSATCYYSGSGSVATLIVSGTFDRTRDARSITVGSTAFTIYKGANLLFDNGVAASTTRSNKSIVGCGMGDITVSTPSGELL